MPLRSDKTLEDLLKDYRDGDVEAFDSFFRQTKKIVYSYIRRRITNQESAQDITQEVYFRIHRYVVTYDDKKGNAISWIRSIAHNCITSYINAQKARQLLTEAYLEALEEEVPTSNDRIFLEEMLAQFNRQLDSVELNILTDRLLSELPFNEIASKRGIRADHARQKFSRIIKKVRKLLTS